MVYKHPKEKFRTILHRNTRHEVVEEEIVPNEHLTRVVADKEELERAQKEGWVLKPFIASAPPDPTANIYDSKPAPKSA